MSPRNQTSPSQTGGKLHREPDWLRWIARIMTEHDIAEESFVETVVQRHFPQVLKESFLENIELSWNETHPGETKAGLARVIGTNKGTVSRWFRNISTISLAKALPLLFFMKQTIPPHGHEAWRRQMLIRLMMVIRQVHLKEAQASLTESEFACVHLFFQLSTNAKRFGAPEQLERSSMAKLVATIVRQLRTLYSENDMDSRDVCGLVRSWNKAYVLLRYAFEEHPQWELLDDKSI